MEEQQEIEEIEKHPIMDAAYKPNIHQRVNAVMAEVYDVVKDQVIRQRFGNNTVQIPVASYASVMKSIRPALVEHGIVVHSTIKKGKFETLETTDDNGRVKRQFRFSCVIVTKFINMDNPEDYIQSKSPALGLGNDDKGPIKAATYGERNNILHMFALPGTDGQDESAPDDTGAPAKRLTKKENERRETLRAALDELIANNDLSKARIRTDCAKFYFGSKVEELDNDELDDFIKIISKDLEAYAVQHVKKEN